MDATQRRKKITDVLSASSDPVSASFFAKELSVSRQIIVGDVAILRASGTDITATPRGYILGKEKYRRFPFEGILACKHTTARLKEELYTVVDLGGTLLDVTIEHSLYGQLSGPLNIGSRYDADLFINKVSGDTDRPLSILSGGIHIHTIGCKDKKTFDLIKESLSKKGIAL